MIKNDKQFGVTKKKLAEFKLALNQIEEQVGIDPILKQIQLDAIKSQIEEFEETLAEYERLKKGDSHFLKVESLQDLPRALISARIVNGWTQSELADKVHIQEQQIQRYEATDYASATINRIYDISQALELNFLPFRIELESKKYNFSETINPAIIAKAKKRFLESQSLFDLTE
jgi:transcriptional regulator with XRE-family HTH domain